MELNILKQDIGITNKIFSQMAEQSIDLDFSLPEYYPKINKVLKCMAKPRISANAINGQILNIEGNINIVLLYITDTTEICSFEYVLPFSRTFEFEGDAGNCLPDCSVREEYINCRLLDERSVELHGAIGISAGIVRRDAKQVICDVEGGDVVLNRGMAEATSPIGIAEKCLLIEEELELGNGQPSIRHILRYDAKAVKTDCKIIGSKVVVRGELKVFTLYCGEQTSTPQVLRSAVPFSQIIDIPDINDMCECDCTVSVANLEIKPRTSITGECRTLSLSAKVRFCASATCDNDVPVVYDAFSTKYETDITLDDILFEKIFKTVNKNFICKHNVEVSAGGIGTIIDLWCEPQNLVCKIENEELHASGNLMVYILAYDSENCPAYYERSVEFEFCHVVKNSNSNMKCRADATVNNVSYTILSNNTIEVCAELNINAGVYSQSRIAAVREIRVCEDALKPKKRDSAMIIYYADVGEKLWDIARKYNSAPDEIAEINSLESEVLATNKVLLIPVK